jgi:hypothetical protein
MRININPINELSQKVLIYPIVPAELWLFDLRFSIITSTVSGTELELSEDDRGLYSRLKLALSSEFRSFIDKFGYDFLLFACAEKQEEAPACSNKIMVYDLIKDAGDAGDPHICTRACQYSELLDRPPFLVLHRDKIYKLYDDKDDIIFHWDSKFPRPLLIRDFKDNFGQYKLVDPYLQWSPPKFWYNLEFMDTIPNNIEKWIEHVINSFNWSYFHNLLKDDDRHRAELDHLVASIFDIIYEEYLYYGVCKRLWQKEDSQGDPYSCLLYKPAKQVIINFTDIVNSIRTTIVTRLLRDQIIPLEDDLVVEKSKNFNRIEKSFDRMFKSIGEKENE